MTRFDGLDALRGFSAVSVLAFHVIDRLGKFGEPWANSVLQHFDLGKFGVSAFFLISGFVIPATFKGQRDFWIGRAVRILPVLWLSIAAMILTKIYHGLSLPTVGETIANMLLVARPTGHDLISVLYWTLELELAFYVLCAAAFFIGCLGSKGFHLFCAIACAVLAIVHNSEWLFFGLMFVGSLHRIKGPWILGAAILIIAGFLRLETTTAISVTLAIPVFLWFFKMSNPPKWAVLLGAITYPLYLLHHAAIELLLEVIVLPEVFAITVVLTSFIAAFATHVFVERPLIDFGKRLRAQPYAGGTEGLGGASFSQDETRDPSA